jgi:uncharacterized membrane protein HdeD (DUF308 family)
MDGQRTTESTPLVAGVERHWEWALAFGIITVLMGALVLAWPGRTLTVVAVLFGIQLMVAGIFRFSAALARDDERGGTRVLLAMLGVLSFVAGLYAVRHVLLTLTALALTLGIFWIVNGAMETFAAVSFRGTPGRGWTIAMGVLSIVAGAVVLAYPGMSLLALTTVLGVWLLVFGGMELVVAFQLRSVGRAASRLAHAAM